MLPLPPDPTEDRRLGGRDQLPPHGWSQIVLGIGQMPPDVGMEAAATNPHRQSIFEAEGTELVHPRRALSDKPVTDAVQGLQFDLLGRPQFHDAMTARVDPSQDPGFARHILCSVSFS